MPSSMSALTTCLAEVIRPLGEAEERRAVAAALARVQPSRPVVHGAELRIEKRRGGVPDRQISVLVADLDGYRVHTVVVADGEVVQATEHPELVPPFTTEEIAEATVLAGWDPEVGEATREWGAVPAPFYPPGDPPGATGRRRLVGVHFLDTGDHADVRPLVSAVVDLTGRQVQRVTRHSPTDSNDERSESHGDVR